MSAMRPGVLLCLLLAAVPLALAHEEPPGPTRMGTVTGRVIEHGQSGSVLKGATVRLDSNGTPLATTLTDSIGTFTFAAPGRLHAIYGVNVELPGWERDGYGHGLVTILSDSVTRLSDFIMWPARYFDWTTYNEFMSAPSIEVHSVNSRATQTQERDSTLLTTYRHYLHPTGPLVVRIGITPPWRDLIAEQEGVEASCLPDPGWPEIKEYGKYLLVDKGRCRFMQVQMWPDRTGMRVWDVDSIVPGRPTKGGWSRGTEQSIGWPTMDGLRVYFHPHGDEFISAWGVWTPLSDGHGIQKSPEANAVPHAGTHAERAVPQQGNTNPLAGEQSTAPQMIAGEPDIPVVPFWKVDVRPRPINIPAPTDPDRFRSSGGGSVVEALLDTNGLVIEARILKPSGDTSFDRSAVEAALKSRFSPAKHRDKAVRVWVSIPFIYHLN